MERYIGRWLGQIQEWEKRLNELFDRISPRFVRKEMREHAQDYVKGLLSSVERKNGWQLAEAVGESSPYAIQHVLGRSKWEADEIRDETRAYAIEHLGHKEAVLAVDETGFLKKGKCSAGVQRQYSGTAGRIENCQIGVFLSYISPYGRALIDRELYLPESWADDFEARKVAHVPEKVEFATKPELARRMIKRAVHAQVPFEWVTGDEVYGNDRSLRRWLEEQGISYVLSIAINRHVWGEDFRQSKIEDIVEKIPAQAFRKLSVGEGAKGLRYYDWARIKLLSWQIPQERWLLVRRHCEKSKEMAFYVVYAPVGCDLETMARIAGKRWGIEGVPQAHRKEVCYELIDYVQAA